MKFSTKPDTVVDESEVSHIFFFIIINNVTLIGVCVCVSFLGSYCYCFPDSTGKC